MDGSKLLRLCASILTSYLESRATMVVFLLKTVATYVVHRCTIVLYRCTYANNLAMEYLLAEKETTIGADGPFGG